MQFQVPQNIAMEDRIIGPITTSQFIVLVIGGVGVFFFINQRDMPGNLENWIAGTLAVITAVIALGKFNDQPLYRFGKFIVAFIFTPKVRVWHKTGVQPLLIKPSEHRIEERQRRQKHVSRFDIAQVAQVVDSRGRTGVVPKVKR